MSTEKCFADLSGTSCKVVKIRDCNECVFYKTHREVVEGNERANKRLAQLGYRKDEYPLKFI